jgi:DNA mismatch repair protein MutS2
MSKPNFSYGRPTRPSIQPAEIEIDLHGMAFAVANESTRRHIERAYNARLHIVKIIHGNGTGALKSAVHELLSASPLVKKFYLGSYGDGGHGVTIAELNYGQTSNYDSPSNYGITPKPERRR